MLNLNSGTGVEPVKAGTSSLHEWGLLQNGFRYRRLTDGFRRLLGSTIFFGSSEAMAQAEVWDCRRLHFFERMRLWFRTEPGGAGFQTHGNLVTFPEAFWEEIRTHPVPVEAEVVWGLANNPGCLALYTWLTWRCFQSRSRG